MSEVAQATHSSPDGHIPQLRFPGFSGVWRENRLGNIARIFDGTHQTPKYVENGIPFYSVEHITANQFDDTKYISEEVFERENMRVKLEREDILMTRIGNIGMAKYIDWNVNASFYVSLALIKKNESFNSKFLSQLIHSPNFQRQLWKRTIHVAFPQKINLGEIGKCESILPTKPEQQKIAAFLTAVDNKIEQLSKKQELLSEYKKGVMQQIFSQAIRFKADDGSDFPGWEEKKLGSLCEITTGKLDANAMVKDGQYRFYTCAKEYYKIDDYAFDTDALIVSGNGANVGYIHHYQGKFNAYQRTYVLDSFTDNIVFVKFVLDGYLHKRIMKEKNEGNTPYIVMGTLTDMKINLPSFSEQTKISNFLSSIDSKIEQVSKQLDESKQFKKALLQQMFV